MTHLASQRGCCSGDCGPRYELNITGRFSGYAFLSAQADREEVEVTFDGEGIFNPS